MGITDTQFLKTTDSFENWSMLGVFTWVSPAKPKAVDLHWSVSMKMTLGRFCACNAIVKHSCIMMSESKYIFLYECSL